VHTIASRRELFAWAMYDFANSGYTTVVLTTVFNAYFVGVVAGRASGLSEGTGTLLWTVAVSIPNALVLVSAPVLGAIADYYAAFSADHHPRLCPVHGPLGACRTWRRGARHGPGGAVESHLCHR
jgi:hypothetical protein